MKTAHTRPPGHAPGRDRMACRGESPRPVLVHFPAPVDPTRCTGCSAVYSRKVWRWPEGPFDERVKDAARGLCPACRQVREGSYFGLVHAIGTFAAAEEDGLRARIKNVARRAGFTQPERRVVSIEKSRSGLEIRTTSEKLAHRIARELQKAFGGEVSYRWSEREGALRAVWTREASSPRRGSAPAGKTS